MAKKEKQFFENELTECVGKLRDLWKALKSLGISNKSGGCIISALAENQIVKQNTKTILKTFKKYLFKPGRNFVDKNFIYLKTLLFIVDRNFIEVIEKY